jgi:hypothetical protein
MIESSSNNAPSFLVWHSIIIIYISVFRHVLFITISLCFTLPVHLRKRSRRTFGTENQISPGKVFCLFHFNLFSRLGFHFTLFQSTRSGCWSSLAQGRPPHTWVFLYVV